MLTATPSLLGVEASDANDVVNYLRSELGLRGKGQLASALAGCPPMLMYHTWDNLRKKARRSERGGEGGCFLVWSTVLPSQGERCAHGDSVHGRKSLVKTVDPRISARVDKLQPPFECGGGEVRRGARGRKRTGASRATDESVPWFLSPCFGR